MDLEKAIEILGLCLTEERKKRIGQVIALRLPSIEVAVEAPSDVNNAKAVVRSSEAFGVTRLHLIAPEPKKGTGRNVMRGSDRWAEIIRHGTLDDFLKVKRGRLYGASPRGTLLLEEVPVDEPFCLLFGNEVRGLSEKAMEACEGLYRIEMQGMAESLNLSVSAALSLYNVTRRRRAYLEDLDITRLTFHYYVRSLGREKAQKLLTHAGLMDYTQGHEDCLSDPLFA